MITLKDIVRSDRAVAAITTEECQLIAGVLDHVLAQEQRSWFSRRRLPPQFREKALNLRMLAATLQRSPPEAAPSLQKQIALKMEADRG